MDYLLHVCCGPCATACINNLFQKGIKPVLFFDNPNIHDEQERELRRKNAHICAEHYGLKIIDGYTPHDEFLSRIKGLEAENEGGKRCDVCFALNAELTKQMSDKLGIGNFSTSLTVSRFKNSNKVFSAFDQYQGFVKDDFKKKDGFTVSCKLARELNLYRQHYCGCEFSKKGCINN